MTRRGSLLSWKEHCRVDQHRPSTVWEKSGHDKPSITNLVICILISWVSNLWALKLTRVSTSLKASHILIRSINALIMTSWLADKVCATHSPLWPKITLRFHKYIFVNVLGNSLLRKTLPRVATAINFLTSVFYCKELSEDVMQRIQLISSK